MKSFQHHRNDPRWIRSKYGGKCAKCGQAFSIGDRIFYRTDTKRTYFAECGEEECASLQPPDGARR
jgi:hypothetical protein